MTEPGIYYDMPRAEYDKIRPKVALNYSTIKAARGDGTMFDLHAQMHRPVNSNTTGSMLVGNATHARSYEPYNYSQDYSSEPEIPEGETRSHKTYQDAKKALKASGKIMLTDKQYAAVDGMWKSLQSEPDAKHLFNRDSTYETTVVWIDEESGVLCKCRADEVCVGERSASDLKTAKSEIDRRFRYSITDYAYDIQAAMCIDGLRANGVEIDSWIWPVVRNTWPYTTNVIQAPQAMLDEARREYKDLLKYYAWCVKENTWPAHGGLHILDTGNSSVDLDVDDDYTTEEEKELNDAF